MQRASGGFVLGSGFALVERLSELTRDLAMVTAGVEILRFRDGGVEETTIGLPGLHSGVCPLLWDDTGTAVFCAMNDRLWKCSLSGAAPVQICSFRGGETPKWLGWSGETASLVACLARSTGAVWDAELVAIDPSSGYRRVLTTGSEDRRIWACAQCADGSIAFSTTRSNDEPATAMQLHRIDLSDGEVAQIGFVPAHGRLALGPGGSILGDAGNDAWITRSAQSDPERFELQCASLHPSGDLIAGYDSTGVLLVVDRRTGERTKPVWLSRRRRIRPRSPPAWSADGRYLAATLNASARDAWNFIVHFETRALWARAGSWRLPAWSPAR